MKKIIISLLSVGMTAILAGCVGQSNGGDDVSPNPTGIQSPEVSAPAESSTPDTGLSNITPSSTEQPVLEVEASNESAAAALQGGLSAYKSMDAAEFDKYFEKGISSAIGTEEQPDEASIEHYKIVFENLSWTIRTQAMDDDKGYVMVDIINGDYAKAMEKVGAQLQQELTEGVAGDTYKQKMNELIKAAMAESVPDEPINTTVFLVKTAEGWKISDDNMPLFIAVRGGGDFFTEAEPALSDEPVESIIATDLVHPSESPSPTE